MSSGSIFDEFVYHVGLQDYVYKVGDSFQLDNPVGDKAIVIHLISRGYAKADVDTVIKNHKFAVVHGHEMAPNNPPIFKDGGVLKLNLWVPPTLTPNPGSYPRLQRVLDHITKGDKQGQAWLKQWMAWKVQSPSLLPKVCAVIHTVQGGGKGTLASALFQMLGPENCETVERQHLENNFNARWVQSLFVLGDEIISGDRTKDITSKLKRLIDSGELEFEAKFQNQKTIRNQMAWMFASNDAVSSVILEPQDRRYSYFSNPSNLTADYKDMFLTMFRTEDGKREIPTDDFMEEISALYHELLATDVDLRFVARPYDNADRRALIEASLNSAQLFAAHVDQHGLDDLIADYMSSGRNHSPLHEDRREWDFGTLGYHKDVVYGTYAEFCRKSGMKAFKKSGLFGTLYAHQPTPWGKGRPSSPKGKRPETVIPPKAD